MVFNAIFNNISVISWRSVFLVEETGEKHRPVASRWQTLSHNVVSSTHRLSGVRIHNVSDYTIESMKAFYCMFIYIYIYCHWRPSYQEGRVWLLLSGLTPPHCCACSNPEPEFPKTYVVVFFVFGELILVELTTITVYAFFS